MTLSCQSFVARQWLSNLPGPSTLLTGMPPVEARSAGEGRGLGLFTTRPIPAYTELLSDPPAILLQPTDDLPQLYHQFLALPQHQQDKYLALSYHDQFDKDAILRQKLLQRGDRAEIIEQQIQVGHVMQTNAFTVDLDIEKKKPQHRALFLDISRVNHACAPNAHVSFHLPTDTAPKGRMVVHSLRDLQAGEEVLISYFNILLPRQERQTKAHKWGFTCRCSVCDTTSPSYSAAEAIRKALRDYKPEQAVLMADPKPSMRSITTLIHKGQKLYSHAGEDTTVHPAFPELCDQIGMLEAKALIVQSRESQRQNVVKWLESSVVWDAKMTGLESPATKRRLEKLEQFANRKGESNRAVLERDEAGNVFVRWRGE